MKAINSSAFDQASVVADVFNGWIYENGVSLEQRERRKNLRNVGDEVLEKVSFLGRPFNLDLVLINTFKDFKESDKHEKHD